MTFSGNGPVRREVLAAGAGLSALMAPPVFADEPATSVSSPVPTNNGPVRGYVTDGIASFLGVRYGAPPVGEKRFAPPERPEPWSETAECIMLGASAIQLPSGGSTVSQPGIIRPALGQMFSSAEDIVREDEDCLFLNVWTRWVNQNARRPVMVWIHGGGYNYGSGSWPSYNGHNLAKNHDVVAISVNHRLNVFGYCNTAQIGGDPTSGNAGMLDLVAVLEWVRDNIENFGGDPDNVTIFGQSGGGAKVSTLMAMPAARGLFHKAIVQSGASLSSGDADRAAESTNTLMAKLGVSSLAELQQLPARTVLDTVAGRINPTGAPGRMSFGPIVDGVSILRHAFTPDANPLAANVAVMVGCTSDERTLYVANTDEFRTQSWASLTEEYGADIIEQARRDKPEYDAPHIWTWLQSKRNWFGSRTLAERKSAQPAPVYTWIFEWPAPVENGLLKAPHTMEIPFCFDNVDMAPLMLGVDGVIAEETRRLGTITSTAWTNFAKTGNPNGPGLPDWPAYDPNDPAGPGTMFFNTPCRLVRNTYAAYENV